MVFFFPLAGSFFSFSWVNDFDFVIFFSAIVWTKWSISTKTSPYSYSHFCLFDNSGQRIFDQILVMIFLVHYFDNLVSFDHIGRYFDFNFFCQWEKILEKIPNFATWAIIKVAGNVQGHRRGGRGGHRGLILDFLLVQH